MALKDVCSSSMERDVEVLPLDTENERMHLVLVPPESSDKRGDASKPVGISVAAVVAELNRNRGRVRHMEEMLPGLLQKGPKESRKLLGELKAMGASLEALVQALTGRVGKEDLRSLVAEVMNAALAAWSVATGTGKVEMARVSKLWRVYMSPDGYERTQTLDKYLNLRSLPKRPRLKPVLQTADFVLIHCESPTPERKRLETALARIQAVL